MIIDTFKGFLYAINIITYLTYSVGYMLLLYLIYSRLCLINKFVRKIADNDCEKNEAKIVDDLKRARILIDTVCDYLEVVKKCYTISNIVNIIQYSFFAILGIYGLISYFAQPNSIISDLAYSLLTIVWIAYYTPFVAWVFVVANLIIKEGKRTEVLVQRIMCKKQRKHSKIHKKVQIILMQLHHRRPVIECGVFIIDWKFLFYTLGVCFSYLVIIIQFEFKNV